MLRDYVGCRRSQDRVEDAAEHEEQDGGEDEDAGRIQRARLLADAAEPLEADAGEECDAALGAAGQEREEEQDAAADVEDERVRAMGAHVADALVEVRGQEREAETTLQTYLAVREDALQLYGFADAEERELFVHLLAVNGVGPKVALTIVSSSKPGELRKAILLEDAKRFEAIPGIGKKTAQRVVLELKEKLGGASEIAAAAGGHMPYLVARDALVELGYTVTDAERVLAETDPDLPPEERVRLALRAA